MVMKYVWGILDLEGKNIQQTNVSYGNLFFFQQKTFSYFGIGKVQNQLHVLLNFNLLISVPWPIYFDF